MTAAVHDAAMLLNPILVHEHAGPMAIALVREGRISAESMGYLSAHLARFKEDRYRLSSAQESANATLTAWGQDHVIELDERVEAARNTLSRVSELGIEQRLEPLSVEVDEEIEL